MEAQFKPGDIFEGEYMHAGSYYQVTASTEKTVTVRPIESGYAGQGRVYTAHSYGIFLLERLLAVGRM